ncbi:LOW QUALITY PROTEIN: hypothetical protein KUTeg_003435 [Tegillarca granosa]|uniref:Uncharacterized protein n=1 Tax=Tegillarca granosa TaxID=220873 RepID=A0ABQ9FM43_TEGGR|nr:LOW QUALITY PROTEIN: hypothetical protein KUTeg_003435 [Tegillarca granosa]
MRNKNTVRKTQSDIKIFVDFLKSVDEWRSPELKRGPIRVLTIKFKMFTIKCSQISTEKKIMDVNILTDPKCKHARDVLSAKMKKLEDARNRPNAADPLNKEEVRILYEKEALGLVYCWFSPGTPVSLTIPTFHFIQYIKCPLIMLIDLMTCKSLQSIQKSETRNNENTRVNFLFGSQRKLD